MEREKFPNPVKYLARDQEEFGFLKKVSEDFYDHVKLYFNGGNTNDGHIPFRKNLGKNIIEVEGETNPIKKNFNKRVGFFSGFF